MPNRLSHPSPLLLPNVLPNAPRPTAGRPARTAAHGATRLAVLLAAVLAAACADLTGPAATSPDPAPARTAYPGFDLAVYPGDAALRAWATPASPYAWVGFYLSAPCHRDVSFGGRRAAVSAAGYGVAVLYVGQQTWDGVSAAAPAGGGPLAERSVVPGSTPVAGPAAARTARLWAMAQPTTAAAAATCSRTLLSAAQGASEGADAVARAAAEGFATGTAIYLDLEPMSSIPDAMRAYYRAWTRAVLADGRYRPAVYCHWSNAAALYTDVRAVFAEFGAGEPRFWVARSAGFSLDRPPADAGFAFAAAWQGVLDVARTWGGVTLTVDESVAAARSPSAP